jgi:hypothetical protein
VPHEPITFGSYRAHLDPELVNPLGITAGARPLVVSLDPTRQDFADNESKSLWA